MKRFFNKFRMIALMLVLVVMGAFCLTACGGGKDGGDGGEDGRNVTPITTVEELKAHFGEVAEIALAIEGVSENSTLTNYEEEKADYVELMEKYIEDYNGGELLQAVTTEVIATSGLGSEDITNYLQAVKENITLSKEIKAASQTLYSKYYELYDDAWYDYYYNDNDDARDEYRAYSAIYWSYEDLKYMNRLSSGTKEENLLSALCLPINDLVMTSYNIEMVAETLSTIIEYKDYIDPADYDKTVDMLRAIYNNGKKFASQVHLEVIIRAMLNAAVSEDVIDAGYDFAYNLADEEGASDGYLQEITQTYNDAKDSLDTLTKGFGLTNQDKKEAYVDMFATLMNNYYGNILLYFELDFDKIVDFAETAYAELEDGSISDANLQTLVADADSIIKEFAQKAKDAALSDEEVEEIISAAKTVNQNGLGYFAERYVPLMGYAQQLEAHMMGSISQEDIKSMANVYIEDYNHDYDDYSSWSEYEKVIEQADVLAYSILAKAGLNAYDSFDKKEEFEKAFVDVVGNQALLTDSLEFADFVAGLCPQDAKQAVSKIFNGQTVFTATKINNLETKAQEIGAEWAMAYEGYIEEDFEDAYDAFIDYLNPIFDVVEMFTGKDVSSYIPQSSDLQDIIDAYANGEDWFATQAAIGTYKFDYATVDYYIYDYGSYYDTIYAGQDGMSVNSYVIKLKENNQVTIEDRLDGSLETLNGTWSTDGDYIEIEITDYPYSVRMYGDGVLRLYRYEDNSDFYGYFYIYLEKVN